MNSKNNYIKTMVLTGGPCAGKSQGIEELKKFLSDLDYKVITIPELATEIRQNGFICSEGTVSQIDFQKVIFEMQIFKEDLYKRVMKKNDKKMVLLLDRGLMDGKVYLSPDEFKKILDFHNLTETDILNRYDAVFHMQSAAVGEFNLYNNSSNVYRFSSQEQAKALEEKTVQIWSQHAKFHFIPVEENFEIKMKKLKEFVLKELENKKIEDSFEI